MARFTQSGSGDGGNFNTTLIKDFVWGYPTPNAVAIEPITQSQSIALKSSGGASLRWHIRDGGQSLANNFQLEADYIIEQSGEMGVGPYQVKFYIGTQESLMPVGYHYTVNYQGPWAGNYIATASTIDTLTLEYPGPDVPGANEDFTGGTISLPSVYNQVEVNEDGAWIKNTNWSEPNGYANYWQFTNDGSIHFPNQSSNSRTGYGDVLKFATSTDQAIIATGETTSSNPTASRLVIAGADGYTGTTGEGGDIYLWAGRGGDAGGTGGDIKIDAGNGIDTGEGGTIKIRGGYSPSGTGGFIEIQGGYGATTGGPVSISSYNSAPITISGDGGEFLNNSSIPSNQIATIGDIAAGTNTYDILYTTHNGDGTNIQIGDDAWIGDINAANYLGIKGVQDPTLGGIVFGSLGLTSITTDSTNLSLSASNDIILNPGSNYGYIGTPLIDGSNRIATVGTLNNAFTETPYIVEGGTTGTQPTFDGTPLFSASYTKTGNLVHFRVNVGMTNITDFGTGQYYVTIPFLSEYDVYVRNGQLKHSSGDMYSISGHAVAGSNQLKLYTTASNGKEVPFTNSVPVGLNSSCDFHIFGSYFSQVL